MGRKLFLLTVSVMFFYVTYPLAVPVVMGAVLAVLFMPLLEKLERHRLGTGVASALLTLGITIVILLPTSLLIFVGAKSGVQQLQTWREAPRDLDTNWIQSFLEAPRVHRVFIWITEWVPVSMEQLIQATQDLSKSIGAKVGEILAEGLSRLPGMTLALVIIVVSVYFFLVDGRKFVHFLRRNSFFPPYQTDHLLGTLAGICRSVVLASVISGSVQAIFEALVCLVTGTPNAPLIAVLVFIGSFIPVVGSAPVTLGVALQQFLAGRTVVGFVLLAAAAIVSVLDNLIRPIFLKGAGNLHPLLAFVAAFGALQAFGFVGIFLGPIVASLFMATIQVMVQGNETRL